MELALQKDCENIIEAFVAKENPRFESFVYQWKSTLFQRIYTGQSLSLEIVQSTNACTHYAKRVLCSSKTAMPRLGALYLLYALHFKQPTDRYHKIDIDMQSWMKIKDFILNLDNMLYSEGAKCIFWELLKQDAFRFVASDTYYGLEKLIDLDRMRQTTFNLNNTQRMFQSDMNKLTGRCGLLTGMVKLEDGYKEMKERLNQNSSDEKFNRVIPLSTGFDELKAAINQLNTFIKKNRSLRPKKVNRAKTNDDRKARARRIKKAKERRQKFNQNYELVTQTDNFEI